MQTTIDVNGEIERELEEWVEWEGHLIRADDARLPVYHDLKILSGFDLVERNLASQMGTLGVTEEDEFGAIPEIEMEDCEGFGAD